MVIIYYYYLDLAGCTDGRILLLQYGTPSPPYIAIFENPIRERKSNSNAHDLSFQHGNSCQVTCISWFESIQFSSNENNIFYFVAGYSDGHLILWSWSLKSFTVASHFAPLSVKQKALSFLLI